jgi:hypothetical protein
MTGPVAAAPRTLANLIGGAPQAHLMVVASLDYVAAIEADLMRAIELARDPDRIVVLSTSDKSARSVLADHVIPSNARLQRRVGGARISLHVRVARKILQELEKWDFSAVGLRERYKRLLAKSAPIPIVRRVRLSDEEVGRFIDAELRTTRDVSCTNALRRLRDRGHACEQSRFKALFCRAIKSHHAF